MDLDENPLPLVVTQVEKDVVVNRVGKLEAKRRIVTFILKEEGFVFEPAKNIAQIIFFFVRTSEQGKRESKHCNK